MKNLVAKTLRNMVVTVLLIAALVSVAPAQELSPDHLNLARRYVELTDQAQIYEVALIETGIETMRTIVSQNPEIADEVSAAIGEVIKLYADRKDELFGQFARIYALRFTPEELAVIVEFYESDVGQKLSSQNAAANQDLIIVMRIFRANLNTEFFAAVRAELREQGINP